MIELKNVTKTYKIHKREAGIKNAETNSSFTLDELFLTIQFSTLNASDIKNFSSFSKVISNFLTLPLYISSNIFRMPHSTHRHPVLRSTAFRQAIRESYDAYRQ